MGWKANVEILGPTSGLLWSLPGTWEKFASTWIMFEESDQRKKYGVSGPGISWVCMSKVLCPKQFSFVVHVVFCVTLLIPKSLKQKGIHSVWTKTQAIITLKKKKKQNCQLVLGLDSIWGSLIPRRLKSLVVKYFMSFTLTKDIL